MKKRTEYALDRAERARIAYREGYITRREAEAEVEPYLKIIRTKEKLYARLLGVDSLPEKTMTAKGYLGIN